MRKFIAMAAAAASVFVAANAAADGLAAKATDIPAADRAKLQTEIASFKKSNPGAFAAVANVKGHKPETYIKFRNPVPLVGRELRRLGKPALLPMLEALAFQAPDLSTASAREREALTVGMLEAVGVLRDPRGSKVLAAAFLGDDTSFVTQTAAEAMGKLCDDSSLDLLSASLASPQRFAAIGGLGECRRMEATQLLADQLDAATTAGEAEHIAEALGVMSSSWAWKTFGKARAAEGLTVRTIATEALARGFVRFSGETRDAHRRGLIMAELPGIRVIAQANSAGASPAVITQLERVVALVEKRAK